MPKHSVVRRNQLNAASREKPMPLKKKTSKWCRGKKGVTHEVAVATYRDIKRLPANYLPGAYAGWLVQYCKECGKELAHWWPLLTIKKDPKSPLRDGTRDGMPKWAKDWDKEHQRDDQK